jgi:hypothetical protein
VVLQLDGASTVQDLEPRTKHTTVPKTLERTHLPQKHRAASPLVEWEDVDEPYTARTYNKVQDPILQANTRQRRPDIRNKLHNLTLQNCTERVEDGARVRRMVGWKETSA